MNYVLKNKICFLKWYCPLEVQKKVISMNYVSFDYFHRRCYLIENFMKPLKIYIIEKKII